MANNYPRNVMLGKYETFEEPIWNIQKLIKYRKNPVFIQIQSLVPLAVSRKCKSPSELAAVCLNVYLERDFAGMEAFIEAINEKRPLMISKPDAREECKKIQSLLRCYENAKTSCNDNHSPLNYLVPEMQKLVYWLCDKNLQLKEVLEHLGCIWEISRNQCPAMRDLTPNVWQQMFRLEISAQETCGPLKEQLRCVNDSKVVEIYCGKKSDKLYTAGMQFWINGLCEHTENKNNIASPFCVLYCFTLSLVWLVMKNNFIN